MVMAVMAVMVMDVSNCLRTNSSLGSLQSVSSDFAWDSSRIKDHHNQEVQRKLNFDTARLNRKRKQPLFCVHSTVQGLSVLAKFRQVFTNRKTAPTT